MISELLPVEVDMKTADEAFWDRYHAYRRLRHVETRPDDPVRPDESVEKDLKRDDPFEFRYRYEISRDGKMLSWFAASTARPGSPGYDTNKHIFWADVSVHKDQRRRGIGRVWLPTVVELMDRHGCTTLSTGTEEESGHGFLKWVGAEEKFKGAENRLKLADVDWGMVRRWVEEGEKRSPDTKLEIYDGRLPASMLADFCPQLSSMLNTMPFEDLDHGEIVVTPEVLGEWYARMDMDGTQHYVMLTREPDGVISGITDLFYAPHKVNLINQGFTGVRPDARGRGLGKWLKAAMLEHARKLHPQLEWVQTENAGSNAPMLGINHTLGFKTYREGSEYQMSRDRLAAKAREVSTRR
jgi:GNAT superfamily N-acetyltransferase